MNKHKLQSGQTLVETVVGLIVLAVGISTALALATSVYVQTTEASQKLVAVGLAREGLEAVFNMRARNWLASGVSACTDFSTGTQDGLCRDEWLSKQYFDEAAINSGSWSAFLTYADDPVLWQLSTGGPYRLYIDTPMGQGRLYGDSSSGTLSNFYRELLFEKVTSAPYDTDVGPKIRVTSRVWWQGRGCPPSDAFPAEKKCRVELSTFLTNWRNF